MERQNVHRSALAAVCAIAACLVAACGGSGDKPSEPHLVTNIAVPNATSPPFTFDVSYADQGRYYLADRNNKAVDVVDTSTNKLIAQIPGGFFGIGSSLDTSGPNGLVGLPGTTMLYVGDVDTLKIIDTSAQTLVKTIPINTAGTRVDGGCFDSDDHLVAITSPAETPPYTTFVNTASQTIVARMTFTGSSGLEACAYDAGTKSFLINNDGTATNPNGELDVISASSVVAGKPVVTKIFPLGTCAPTGLALGPNQDVMIGCDPPVGSPLITLILDRTNGNVLAKLPFGGVDQIAYDQTSNRYFLPARHATTNGIAAASHFTPEMAVVDGSSRTIITTLPVGSGAHSVAVDGQSGQVYVPYQPGADAAFPNAGISVFTVH